VVAAVALVRLLLFLRSPLDHQLGLIPDDAFYYLVSAKHFAELGRWTFDGVAPASGFHLLYAYLLAGLFRVAPHIGDAVLFAVIDGFATLLLAGAAFFSARAVGRDFGVWGVPGVVLAFVAPVALQQQTFMVESCLVLFFTAALLDRVSAARDGAPWSNAQWAGAFTLGLLANLSRSDFGLLPAACALVLGATGRRRAAAVAATATLGAAAGVAVLLLHGLWSSGELIQASARVKSHWSALLGYDIRGYVRVLLDLVEAKELRLVRLVSLPMLLLAAGAFGAWRRFRSGTLPRAPLPLAAGCALAVTGYTLFYGRASSGVPPWYLAHALIPCAYLIGGLLSQLDRPVRWPATALLAATVALSTWASLIPIWPHQTVMRAAGEYLRTNPDIQPVGAWNAGMISFFSRRAVTNLDGLINDDIYPYAVEGTLLEYVCLRKLEYLFDFSEMLEDPYLRTRNGYADGRLPALAHEQLDLSHGDPALMWTDTDMKLYRIDRSGCSP
jgi:hypothetical protein